MALGAAYGEAARGNVLNALAHPTVVNPVAAISGAAQAANTVYAARQNQAQQAIGGILQQATDTNGNVDYGRAQSLAAQAGPVVQMGMQNMLLNNSRLRNDQLSQGGAMTSAIARAALTIQNDPSDSNVNQVFDGLTRMYPGNTQQIDSERQAFLGMSDQKQRATYAYQHGISQLDAHDAMLRSPYGATTSQDIGGTQQPVTVTQPSPYGPGGQTVGPGVTRGAPPGQFVPSGTWVSDGKGGRAWVPGQVPASTVQPGGQPVPGQPSTSAGTGSGTANAPPIPPPAGTTLRSGYQPRPGTSTAPTAGASASPPGTNTPPPATDGAAGAGAGGKGPAPSAAPVPSPPSPAPSGPASGGALKAGDPVPGMAGATVVDPNTGLIKLPNGNLTTYKGGFGALPSAPAPRADLGGGVQVASADGSAPNLGPASAPSPAVAGDVGAIQRGMANARAAPVAGVQTAQNYPPAGTPLSSPVMQTPQGPMIQSGPPMGYGERLKQDQDSYAADQNNLNTRFTNVQNLNTALDALKLTNTGRSTEAVHNFYSFLVSQGVAPGFVDNDVAQYDIARKAMMAFAASRAGAGGTDLARVQSSLSNASPEISQAASEHVLKQNLGNERMEIAANLQHGDKSGAGYGASKAQFYQDNDPRAFAWDAYGPAERSAIIDDAKKTKGGLDKLRASLQRAIDLKLVRVPQQQQSQAAPTNGSGNGGSTTAPPNALAAPTNALAAANAGGSSNALAAA